jgi:hypothetical protein
LKNEDIRDDNQSNEDGRIQDRIVPKASAPTGDYLGRFRYARNPRGHDPQNKKQRAYNQLKNYEGLGREGPYDKGSQDTESQ